ncbi:phospholipid/cholesterol/gamma-HCH transport system substrate-binding protein [Crossiella equi]|uniref:Phospholipid/cholesterol/gamma-HCH transport system substrate-binding protein n=1 Tax=Crossiella equi TaxID=130796 RepID=A0ABS5A8Y8_9PSEU|nr:MCE family protein [Crossiella equi]MBP2473043.1 phospholipid/cholesterol/gamma-HCH transport system substrate-binding protein [Crossiella equi]
MRRALALLPVLALSGCTGLYGVPLPGGADLGSRPYHVTVHLADALDLVPQSGVKVNDVPVGRVEEITLAPDHASAHVRVAVHGDVRLPANALARLRQSSLLGEKFIELQAPRDPTGALADGAVIPVERTNRSVEIEEVLGALSLLLNGGGVAQLRTVTRELGAALSGNEQRLRGLLSTVDRIVTDLDGQRVQITRAIDAMARLSTTLLAQRGHLTKALDELAPGLRVLNTQRDQLVDLLRALDRLAVTATDTVRRGTDDLVADLRLLEPVLRQLAAAGENLPKSLEVLVTFPFTDYTLKALKGDYVNADVTLDLDLTSVLDNLSRANRPVLGGPRAPEQPSSPGPAALLPGPPPPPPPPGLGELLSVLLGGRR